MDINLNPKKYNTSTKKGGLQGNKMWTSHRLEGGVKNRAIKPVRKAKRQQGK